MKLFSVKSNTMVLRDSCICLTISDFYIKILPSPNMDLKKACNFQNYFVPLPRP